MGQHLRLWTAVLCASVAACGSQASSSKMDAGQPAAAATPRSGAAKQVFDYLAGLNADGFHAAVVGQNCGHGSQIATPSDTLTSYDALVRKLHDGAGKWVGIVGVDYEHDTIFRPEQLTQANAVLIDHWNKGGLVTV